MSEGFFSGLVQGQQASDEHQMAQMALQGQEEKNTLTAQQIELTQRTLDQQKVYMRAMQTKMQKLNSGQGGKSGPEDQAEIIAQTLDESAQAHFSAGQFEEGSEDAAKASTIRGNAAKIKEVNANVQAKNAGYAANLMQWVLDAPGEQEAQQRWRQAHLLFTNETGVQSKYFDKPYNRRTVEGLKAMTETAQQKALEDERRAQMANVASEIDRRNQQNRRDQERLDLDRARETRLAKEGGKTAKAEADRQSRIKDVMTDVDGLIAMIQAHPDMTFTGFKGTYHKIGESVAGALGYDQDNPEHQFSTLMNTVRMKLPRAMTGSGSRSSKDERELARNVADLSEPGISTGIALDKLNIIRASLQSQLTGESLEGGTIIRPGVVQDGYRFKGGDPADKKNWEPVNE